MALEVIVHVEFEWLSSLRVLGRVCNYRRTQLFLRCDAGHSDRDCDAVIGGVKMVSL